MNQKQIIEKTKEFIRKRCEGDSSGHDWWHIYRVWKNAMLIGKQEKANLYIVQLAALLHDIADFKFHQGDISIGPKLAREYLQTIDVEEIIISPVCEIIKNLSFKGLNFEKPMPTIEGKVVRDADRLDAMGAIGIARCFAYGGYVGTPIHNPETKPSQFNSVEEYVKSRSGQINHFYEKLLHLKDLMQTETGKKLAEQRHKYMLNYLQQFFAEWKGKR